MEYFESKEKREKLLLLAVAAGDEREVRRSLAELEDLVETAGAIAVGSMIQARDIHPVTYVGSGKLDEIREMLYALDADGIVCDDELSPLQYRTLGQELDCKVMDRTLVILDIFAGRASSREGKLQVELAQLRYRAARLTGKGIGLSRLGGGIGTRGPGEKKLEQDKRLIRNRISRLKKDLEGVVEHRDRVRENRSRKQTKTAAVVGYTNAGKSTLLNVLTNAGILEEDQLFATLDPTTRILDLPGQQQILLTDTVGFIRKLPHHLIDAFKSTLEEAKFADVIIHVVDASSEDMEGQMDVVYRTLDQLQVVGKKVITLFNKQDKLDREISLKDFRADLSLKISAKNGQGLEAFKEELARLLKEDLVYVEKLYTYQEAGIIGLIRGRGQILEEEYLPEGIKVLAYVPVDLLGKI